MPWHVLQKTCQYKALDLINEKWAGDFRLGFNHCNITGDISSDRFPINLGNPAWLVPAVPSDHLMLGGGNPCAAPGVCGCRTRELSSDGEEQDPKPG